ncbi:MAG: dicarboxylate/amino acid:cation symporter [Vulcanimicrobiota bacterium]
MHSPSDSAPTAPPRKPVPIWLWALVAVTALAVAGLWSQPFVRYILAAELMVVGFYRRSTANWIVIMMVIGIFLGYDFKEWGPAHEVDPAWLQLPSKVFIRLVKTVVAPLLFSTLVIGISSHADIKTVGRLGVKSLIYFETVTTVALFVGLGAINFSKAGVGMTQDTAAATDQIAAVHQTPIDILLHTFPENIAKSVAEGDVLQVVVFSILFGVALALVPEERRKPLLLVIESLAETMFKFTGVVMTLAPLAVGSAMAFTVAKLGVDKLKFLGILVLTLFGALIVFVLCVLLPIIILTRVPMVPFLRAVSEPVSIAFATSTSEAALPRAMERLEWLGVPRHVVSFVMPLGYSFNLDGTTLYLALASVFVAQANGVELSLGTQLAMMASLMLSSKGVAGVPRASLVILLGTVARFNLPEWPVMAILGIDGIMDMARTGVNVGGNCLASVVVARWEGNFTPNYAHPFYEGCRPAGWAPTIHHGLTPAPAQPDHAPIPEL